MFLFNKATQIKMVAFLIFTVAPQALCLSFDLAGTWYTGSNNGTPSLSSTTSNSFIWGTDGTSATASTGSLWSYFPDMTLANDGDAITLSFTVTPLDASATAQSFRFGLYNDGGIQVLNNLNNTNEDNGFLSTLGYFAKWNQTGTTQNLWARTAGKTNACSDSSDVSAVTLTTNDTLAVLTQGTAYDITFTVSRNSATEYLITSTVNGAEISGTTGTINVTSFNTVAMLLPPAGIDSLEFANLTVIENSAKAKMKVYLLGGQSNMDGRADNDDLPSELQLPQSDVQIYFEGSWYELQPGLSFLELGQSFGPEVTFGRALADSYNENIVLVKYSRGGTSLAVDWNPSSGSHYEAFVSEVNAALNDLVTEYDVEVAGMIWMQGERDSQYLDMANAYEANLTDFIAAVRVEFSVADMPFVIGQISDAGTWTYGDIVRQAQANVSENVGDTALVITSDLTLNGDGIHYDAQGQMTLGMRFADAMILLEQGCGDWGYAPGDINRDCAVDMEDMALFASSWMSCSIPNISGCINYLEQ